jgi:signal transduction histidine kinase
MRVGSDPDILLSLLRAHARFGIAVYAATRAHLMPWARRVSPLLVGMGLAETLRSLDAGLSGSWTFMALLLCVSVSALAARSALLDLDEAVAVDEDQRSHLTVALHRASDEAHELTEWRRQLTHDARNACAGLRAALSILERYDGQVDPETQEKLRLAAVQELGHIEHLLTRSADEPCGPFEVTEVVRRVAEAAWALGARVSVQGLPVHVVGRPGDLVAVLKNLLVNAQTHAPGSPVHLRVVPGAETVSIVCSDEGPGLSLWDAPRVFDRGFRGRRSQGSGLGLHGARELMREQGGELSLDTSTAGATFVVTLPRAATTVRRPYPVRVPAQRALAPSPTHTTPTLEQPVA